MEYGKRLMEFIEKFNTLAEDQSTNEAREFFRTYELEMAKAFMGDFPDASIRVSKIILALKDIGDIKVKFE